MEERLINSASFSKICKILQKKKSVWEEVKPLLQATMLIVPVLVNKDFVTAIALKEALEQGITWLDSGEKVENAITSIKNLVSKQDEDFATRAENAQIANALLVFSAYFDTVKIFLPDKEGNIYLDEVQYCLTEKSLKAYQERLRAKEDASVDTEGRKIADWDLMLPNPLEGLGEYEKRLKEFYLLLNDSFRIYIEGLSCTEDMQEHLRGELNRRIEMIPEAAVVNYRAQYYSLAAICPDFFVWANQQEHQQQRELVDRGFQTLAKQIHNIPEAINEYTANEALTALRNWYTNRLRDPIIPIKDMPLQDQEMRLPTRESIFVPQAYEWLIYRERISVEATQMWKAGGEIGPDILKILRSPELGCKPILILGDPGAGKTMLCHMLAGKILCGEYHVIILHLRDLNAELSIADQIGQAIADATDDCDCKWGTIAKAKPQKPILLIFDGYDELLQASGKTYSNYLEKIVAFQEKQWESRSIVVRSIVTSRIVLIDKVVIPTNSVIIRLKQFDESRINEWCAVWNNANETYFESRGLCKFKVEEGSKAWELAGEPLLLLMLALFDTKDNALRKHQNLQATELYGSLIRDFVEREKKKNPDFEAKVAKIQKKEIEKEVERIAIAALGMYNRNALHITSGQLEDDLKLLTAVNTGRDLRDSEQLLGSFFFIHDLTTRSADTEEKEKLRAYTFLHNTFGEFLAAYYIVFQLYNLIDDLKRHVEKYEDAPFSLKDRTSWYACLSYAPLFRRPVVGKMIREWAPQYFHGKGLEIDNAMDTINELLDREIPRLLHGEVIAELETVSNQFRIDQSKCEIDLMDHLAIYTNNILSLAALLTKGVSFDRIEIELPEAWNKLLHLWRYAFDENDLAAFAGQFEMKIDKDNSLLVASDITLDLKSENDRLKKLYKTYSNLQEEPARSILGTLLGIEPESTCLSLEDQGLYTEAKSILLGIILERAKKKRINLRFTIEEHRKLRSYPEKCITEGDYGSLYAYFLVLNDIAAFSKEGARYVLSLLDFNLLTEVYTHCSRHHPATTIPILELLGKLLPIIRNRDFYMLLDRLSIFYEFESQLTERSMQSWADLLLQCVKRAEPGAWLNACWKLLRNAERCLSRGRNPYSYKTIEKLCYLSLEANKKDPQFPLDFICEVRNWMEERISQGNFSISIFPVIELLEKYQQRSTYIECHWMVERILDSYNYKSGLSNQSILILADVLLKRSSQIDVNVWLQASWKLLESANQYFHKRNNRYTDETIDKLFLLSLKAMTIDPNFPPDFVLKHAHMRVQYMHNNGYDNPIPSNTYFIFAPQIELSICVIALHIMLLCEKTLEIEKMQICESTDILLRTMHREEIKLSDVLSDKTQVVIALCHTVDEYSEEAREYVLTELTEFVRAVSVGVSLELYRMLSSVAERFNCLELKKELEQLW